MRKAADDASSAAFCIRCAFLRSAALPGRIEHGILLEGLPSLLRRLPEGTGEGRRYSRASIQSQELPPMVYWGMFPSRHSDTPVTPRSFAACSSVRTLSLS